ncbi:CNT family concentrative nucleoside transporter [Blastomyces parvus]|uniref:CNT family concentrative nucleoside transporter n=1 Tax=Blastomyces parvus TaxID=2060905 RepID=A0A2B7WZA6_9EURO|nr:CNT family concentrative nucleoside transporter [Blastomyces parvus]
MDSKTPDVPPPRRSADPALDPAHQHHHAHHQHSAFAEKGREDEVVYAKGIDPSNIPDQSPLDHGSQSQSETKPSGDVEAGEEDRETGSRFSRFRKRHRAHFSMATHAVIWMLFTGWWIAGLILRRKDLGWVVPFLVYLAISLRLLFFYVPISIITKPMRWVWHRTAIPVVSFIPEKYRTPLGALVVVAVFVVGSFASEESADNTRENRAVSLFGLLVLIFTLWATSNNRKRIVWQTVLVGMLVQFLVALFVLRTQVGYDIFNFISGLARALLGFAGEGTAFLTRDWVPKEVTWFLVTVVPAIIFFVSLVQLLYYFGFIQWFIGKFAKFFFWSMHVSGAEAVVAAASPFIGQGESAMLIRPFINHLTKAEIHQIMCSGFATIAGSVLIAYVSFGVNPQALISSCVMSIPASLAVSKMRFPETEETLTAGRVIIPDDEEHRAKNALHAFANGAWLGLKIGAVIMATLLCIISLLGLVNGLLTWWGRYLNINDPPLTLEMIVGYICYPISFLLGVSRTGDDIYKVAKLIGLKLIANEFVAYEQLQNNAYYADISPRSRLIATYALCGFANIGSLGNQIGVLSQLAPGRSADVTRVAFSAMLTGAMSTFSSASIAGLIVTDQQQLANTAAPQ